MDLTSKAPVRSPDSDDFDDFAVLDLLDALVRKSLLVADRSAGRTRYSMLETIRQFAEEQLVARGEATESAGGACPLLRRTRSGHHGFVGQPPTERGVHWFTVELANLRTAFRWAADRGDLDNAATIATYAGFLGYLVENYEPIAWAEELIEPARAVDHPRLAVPVRGGVAVLHGRTDRGSCPLQRRRSDGSRQSRRRRAALRPPGLDRRRVYPTSASPNGQLRWPASSSRAAATPIHSPGQRWSSH